MLKEAMAYVVTKPDGKKFIYAPKSDKPYLNQLQQSFPGLEVTTENIVPGYVWSQPKGSGWQIQTVAYKQALRIDEETWDELSSFVHDHYFDYDRDEMIERMIGLFGVFPGMAIEVYDIVSEDIERMGSKKSHIAFPKYLKVGDEVYHPREGEGVVEKVVPGDFHKYKVKFKTGTELGFSQKGVDSELDWWSSSEKEGISGMDLDHTEGKPGGSYEEIFDSLIGSKKFAEEFTVSKENLQKTVSEIVKSKSTKDLVRWIGLAGGKERLLGILKNLSKSFKVEYPDEFFNLIDQASKEWRTAPSSHYLKRYPK